MNFSKQMHALILISAILMLTCDSKPTSADDDNKTGYYQR